MLPLLLFFSLTQLRVLNSALKMVAFPTSIFTGSVVLKQYHLRKVLPFSEINQIEKRITIFSESSRRLHAYSVVVSHI